MTIRNSIIMMTISMILAFLSIHAVGAASLYNGNRADNGPVATVSDDPVYLFPYQYGREYFFLRSGRAKMVIQSDKAGLAPAFTYLLFDAEQPGQTVRKKNALNYIEGTNFSQTSLKVILGKVEFSALGINSQARWVAWDNAPAVELVWWAGGIRVKETFAAGAKQGSFDRIIALTSADMAGDDTLSIAALDGLPETGPIPIKRGETITIKREVAIPSLLTNEAKDLSINKLSTISTSDNLIGSLYRNASFALPGMVSPNGRMDAGVFEYGNQWVRDGSNVAMGLIYSGYFESARGLLNYILSDLVSEEGTTAIAGGFDAPDREQFDQMGVLMNALKLFSDWTGDQSLITTYRKKILALIERPLNPVFRDSTGMVHNKREFWERTFSDGYEMVYQVYMIQGLRCASDLAGVLGVPEKGPEWRKESDVFLKAMLHHPTRSLVDQGALIKRRNVNGEIDDLSEGRRNTGKYDAPVPTEYYHKLNPDATYAIPVLLGVIDPSSDMARRSLDKLEQIWNSRWSIGGYERYLSSSQQDQPGPWTFGTAFIARAQHDAGLTERSRRSMEWLYNIQGGNAGAWFEELPLNRSQVRSCGIVPWTSAEVTSFVVRHWLGVKISGDELIIKPNLYANTQNVSTDLRFRQERLKIQIDRNGKKEVMRLNGKVLLPNKAGEYKIRINNNR